MKRLFNRTFEILLAFSALLFAVSCTNFNESTPKEEITDIEFSDYRQKIQNVTRELYVLDPLCGFDNVEKEVASRLGVNYDSVVQLRSVGEESLYIPSEEASKALSEMSEIDPSNYNTKSEYINALLLVVSKSSGLTEIEREGLQVATYVSADLVELKYGDAGIDLRAKWWDNTKAWCKKQWNDWGRCAAGIVGGAGLAGLEGASIGSALPGLGTAAGAVIGGVSGGLTGAAAAC